MIEKDTALSFLDGTRRPFFFTPWRTSLHPNSPSLQPFEFPAAARKIPLSSPPLALLSPLQGSAMISRRRYIRARGRRGMHKISSLHGDQEEKTESRWPFTAGQPRYANSSRHR